MDVLTAILGCSMYMDDNLTRAIMESTSQSNPYFVQNTSLDFAPPEALPTNADDATMRAETIAAHGGRAVLGVMQIPVVWLKSFGRTTRDAFDPCINVTIGTAMLSQFAYECRRTYGPSSNSVNLRPCILRKYASASGMLDFEVITNLELRDQRPPVRELSDGPIYRPSWGAWGADCILVPLGNAR